MKMKICWLSHLAVARLQALDSKVPQIFADNFTHYQNKNLR